MAQATNSLPQSTLDTFQPICASAVRILATLAARKAVTEQLRDEGRRVTLIPPREINAKAQAYLADHRDELYREALVRAQRMGLYDKALIKARRKQARSQGLLVTPDWSRS